MNNTIQPAQYQFKVTVTRGTRIVDEFVAANEVELQRAKRIWTRDLSGGTRSNRFRINVEPVIAA